MHPHLSLRSLGLRSCGVIGFRVWGLGFRVLGRNTVYWLRSSGCGKGLIGFQETNVAGRLRGISGPEHLFFFSRKTLDVQTLNLQAGYSLKSPTKKTQHYSSYKGNRGIIISLFGGVDSYYTGNTGIINVFFVWVGGGGGVR